MMFSRSLMPGMKTCMNRSNQGVLQHVRTRTTLPSAFQPFYKTVFKNNFTYVTYIVVGAIAFEIVYGKFGDFVWETSNQGVRSYMTKYYDTYIEKRFSCECIL